MVYPMPMVDHKHMVDHIHMMDHIPMVDLIPMVDPIPMVDTTPINNQLDTKIPIDQSQLCIGNQLTLSHSHWTIPMLREIIAFNAARAITSCSSSSCCSSRVILLMNIVNPHLSGKPQAHIRTHTHGGVHTYSELHLHSGPHTPLNSCHLP